MRLHYIQHVPFEGPGSIMEWAKARGLDISATKLFDGEPFPDLDDLDILVVMGGPMGVNDVAEYPWLTREKAFIKEAIGRDKVVVGICLGAQIISECLGGVVRKNKFREVGWFPVSLTPPAWEHPIFKTLPATFDALHWHGDTFSIPKGALHIASSEGCPNQAFIYDERVIGLQFHLETTPESLEDIMGGSPGDMEAGEGEPYVQGPQEIKEKAKGLLEGLKKNLFKLMDAIKERCR